MSNHSSRNARPIWSGNGLARYASAVRSPVCTNASTGIPASGASSPSLARLNIRRDTLEASILSGLDRHLMEPALFKEFCEEFTREVKEARMEARVSIDAAQAGRTGAREDPGSLA